MKKIFMLFIVLFVAFLIILSTIILGVGKITDFNTSGTLNPESLPGNSGQDSDSENVTRGTNSGSASNAISLSDLAKHNTRNDCWVVYKGKAYDLTSWLSAHPGGSGTISPYCGTTGFEQAFTRQHGTRQASLFIKVAIYIGDFKEQGEMQ